MKSRFVGLGLLLLAHLSWGQNKTLHPEAYLKIVEKYHPVARQAQIGIKKTDAQILQARAEFDPILKHYITSKTLDGTSYYQYNSPELNIPTWYGIEVNSGIENLQGDRLDPSQTTGQTSYIGIQVPIAKNLLMDKRRAALQQAKLMNQMAFAEQRVVLNQLFSDAMEAYWHWLKCYQVLNVTRQNLDAAKRRIDFVKRSVELGDRPAVDTLEANTQFMYLDNQFLAKSLDYENAILQLSAFLWQENNSPLTLHKDILPAEVWGDYTLFSNFDLNLQSILEKVDSFHPEIQAYQFKIEGLNVEKRLKFQSLLPKIDLQYNHLMKDKATSVNTALFTNNYRFGIKFEMPLRLSLGRGEYQSAKLKIEEETILLSQKKQQIQIKINSYFNQFQTLKKQIQTQEKAVSSYTALTKAEESKFAQGESSLFLINSREIKALEASEKLLDLKAYLFKTVYALQASAGLLI
ncbi:TolC family protein [Aquirufa rosea]|nr:TolC family protein [Aquirufa rosea]